MCGEQSTSASCDNNMHSKKNVLKKVNGPTLTELLSQLRAKHNAFATKYHDELFYSCDSRNSNITQASSKRTRRVNSGNTPSTSRSAGPITADSNGRSSTMHKPMIGLSGSNPDDNFNLLNNPHSGSNSAQHHQTLDDQEMDFEKLRCTAVSTEDWARRKKRELAGGTQLFPGLCLSNSLFRSGAMMKFTIIGNELHNIIRVHLKRAEAEVATLHRRILNVELELEKSNERLKITTGELGEVAQDLDENARVGQAMETCCLHDENDTKIQIQKILQSAMMLSEDRGWKPEEVT